MGLDLAYFLQVLFSANHGLLIWTPLLLFAVAGIIYFLAAKSPGGLCTP